MGWDEATRDWPGTLARLKKQFPRIDQVALRQPPGCFEEFRHHLAQRHDLTLAEAEQAWLDHFPVRHLQ
jgi:hypothetical protein